MNIPILYEDTNILVLNKPAGIAVHTDGKGRGEETVVDFILAYYPKLKNVGEPYEVEVAGGEKVLIPRPGIVHRLDKETSGALIVAKNQKTFEMLKEEFKEHKIQKVYRAFVYGPVKDPVASLKTGMRGVIDSPIGRSPTDARMWTAGRGAREPLREARTEYIVLKRFSDEEDNIENEIIANGKSSGKAATDKSSVDRQSHMFSYVEAYPRTGRTHQLRVHFRFINHPIVSDPIYRGSKEPALGMKRLALHAYKITFTLSNGEKVTIEASLPKDFESVIKKYIK